MNSLLKSFDKEFPLHAMEVYDRLEYPMFTIDEGETWKERADFIIEELGLDLEAYVETWSRRGEVFEVKLVVTELADEVDTDEVYENLKSQISW